LADQVGLATNFYHDPQLKRAAVKLLPGEYFVVRDNRVLCTVLGSCVSACIRDPVAGVAGMNHFLLPIAGRNDDVVSARYGVHAMELLINGLLKNGAKRARMQVKLFGGGNLMGSKNDNNVGHNNARFALQFMREEGLSVISQDLFGHQPRKIWYLPESGKVMLRRLITTRNDTILRREIELSRKLREAPDADDNVELFT
jgi:chemotaxis protein CheD